MKVVFFGNGPLAERVLSYILSRGDQVVGVVLHPEDRARDRELLADLARRAGAAVLDANRLKEASEIQAVKALDADIGVSVMFGYILRPEILDLFPRGCVNLHPALLPYNRGAHPNVWSIVDGTPAGVTLHLIDPGVDTGPILAQARVEVRPEDTAATLYARLQDEAGCLFEEWWPNLGVLKPVLQDPGSGSFHKVADLASLDEIELDRPTTAREVINRLRARTFPPYQGAYFVAEDGRKIFLRLELTPESE